VDITRKSPSSLILVSVLFFLPILVCAHIGGKLSALSVVFRPDQSTGNHQLVDFHSNFWVNLHHFLYEEAVVTSPSNGKTHDAVTELSADKGILAVLTIDEQKEWKDALSYYRTNLVDRDLLFDDRMVATKNRLEALENEAALHDSGLDAPLEAVLQRAAPIYRAHWWPEHDRANRDWIAKMSSLVRQYGDRLATSIAGAYDTQWPASPIRVDVVAYANWAGAYTTLDPTRVTISSSGARNQSLAGLETVFHESSHALVQNVSDAIAQECAARHVVLPRRDLWHAVLFFTAGYYLNQLVPDYTPYADQNGLWTRAWPMYRAAIVNDWQAHLEGKTTLHEAISRLVADVGAPAANGPEKSPASH